MTHHDSEAGEACALWCLAIRHAVLGQVRQTATNIEGPVQDRARIWTARLDKAEAGQPSDFENNGWVVEALQGAWSAITITAEATGPAHLRLALEAAVRGGRDTDTVTAIAGSLIGGLYGASAVPAQWRRELRGWPGQRARHLIRLGVLTARGGESDSAGWPAVATMDYSKFLGSNALAPHPHDDHVWIGGVDALDNLPDGADAVVSLCRLGSTQVPAPGVDPRDHVEVWLLDESEPDKNPNLDFVLTDAVAAVEALRAEGRTVLLHCVQAQSRTPAVAALYGARLTGRTPTDALDDIAGVLPKASLINAARKPLLRLALGRTPAMSSSASVGVRPVSRAPYRAATAGVRDCAWTQCNSTVLPSARNASTAATASVRTKSRFGFLSGSDSSSSQTSTWSRGSTPGAGTWVDPSRQSDTTASAPSGRLSRASTPPIHTWSSWGCGANALEPKNFE